MNFYGFFVGLGILAGAFIADRINKHQPLITKHQLFNVFDFLPFVLLTGIAGARLYHVLDYWWYYSQNLIKTFFVWEGGLGIFGAIIGGVIGLWIYLKLKIKNVKCKIAIQNEKFLDIFMSFLDCGAIVLPIGQAIGRWGNYFNQELYGLPTDLPWAIYIRPENRISGFENYSHFHPLFLYESIGCFLIFLILIIFRSKREDKNKQAGEIFFLYLFLYSLLRFFLEFLRPRSWTAFLPVLGEARINQLAAVLLMFFSCLWFAFNSLWSEW